MSAVAIDSLWTRRRASLRRLDSRPGIAWGLAIVLFVVTIHFGSPQEGVYVPPRFEGGRIVPGHMESRPGR